MSRNNCVLIGEILNVPCVIHHTNNFETRIIMYLNNLTHICWIIHVHSDN